MSLIHQELRHLGSLVAFEAAARHGNFTAAASELFVSRVAISRHIKTLEDDIGVELFQRQHRGVSLTAHGERLFEAVGSGLQLIADTQQAIRREREKQIVSVTMTAAYAAFWLIPRIGRFKERYPDIDLRLVVSDSYLDLREAGIDAAIRWGNIGADDHHVEPMFDGASIPLCSRDYLARIQPVESPADLLNASLIHLEGSYRSDAKWPDWFQQTGVDARSLPDGIYVDSYSNMIQAAILGQGVALGDVPMLNQLLDEGLLVPAIEIEPIQRDYFFLVVPRGGGRSHALACFTEWLQEEIKKMSETR